MKYTQNYNLKKPEGTDVVNIDDLNNNADIIDTELAKRMINSGGVPSIQSGLDADKPTAGTTGRIYIATDTQLIYRDTGTAWQKVGVVNWGDIDGKPSTFTPSAHKSTHATGGADALMPADIGAVNKAGDTIKPSTDSTTAFQVQKSDGSVVLDVDTTNKGVGIQTNSPDQPLTVAGNIKTTNQFISTVATGTAPLSVSSTTVVSNLNADKHDGYDAGNSSGQIPVSNGTVNTNLNADMTDGIHFQINNGVLQYNNGTGWQNVMTSVINSIQRGTIESSATGDINITINTVNVNKAVVVTSGDGYGSYNNYAYFRYAVLTNSTTLTIKQRICTGNWSDAYEVSLSWQVIEYV
jgi:hypothetical protein